MNKTLIFAGALAASLAAGTANAQFYGILGLGNTNPDSDNGTLAGDDASVDDAWALTGGVGYRFTPSMFADLSTGITDFSHTVQIAGLGNVADLNQRPVTLSFSYQFLSDKMFRPYLTAGYGWNVVSGEKTVGALAGLDIDVGNGSGFVWGAGADLVINENWFIRGDFKQMNFDADVSVETLGDVGTANVDPWLFNLSVGYQF
jgi:outer membrane protein